MKRFWRILGYGVLGIVLVGTLAFVLWASFPAGPEPQAFDSLGSDPDVQFESLNNWLVFSPEGLNPETGLIFYPGARVDKRAYAPLAQSIAKEGFTVIIVPMPLNFAFLDINRASEVMQAFPHIDHWAVGGHSLGGAMAAEFGGANLDAVDGLVFWASYPGGNNDLSETDLQVLSIYASNDGLASPEEVLNSRERLPDDAQFIEIEGGNHAGFGWYGPQSGDGERQIPKSTQINQVVAETAAFLGRLED